MNTATTRNPTLTLLIGLPAHVQTTDVVVSRSSIREMVGAKVDEDLITNMMIALAAVAVHSGGKNVTVIEPELSKSTLQSWVWGFEKKCNLEIKHI